MIRVKQTAVFESWLERLRDQQAKARIAARILRIAGGNLGDVRPVGGGISELRLQFGPGYRIYFVRRGQFIVVLLCGGDKSTQSADIRQAQVLLAELENENGP